jgi:hypothetical protein
VVDLGQRVWRWRWGAGLAEVGNRPRGSTLIEREGESRKAIACPVMAG